MDTNVADLIGSPSSQNLFLLFGLIALAFAPPILFHLFRGWLPADTDGQKRLVSRLSGVAFMWLFCAMGVAIGAALTF